MPFQPLVRPVEDRPSLYIGFDESRPLQGSPLNLFFDVIQPRYGENDAQDPSHGAQPPLVIWRYWDGEDWARLPVEDETRNFTESGRVRFVAPYNLSAHVAFGARSMWLKASLEDGDFARPPRFAAIYLNTVWASHGVTLKDQTLGSSNGERNQSFTFAKAPVLKGEVIELREASLPSATEQARIYADEGAEAIRTVRDDAGNILEVWVRWHAVDHFSLSGPGDRHYVADRVKGVILFGDGVRGLIPPSGKDNIRASFYRSGGGQTGNRAAGVITELKTTIPFVDAVVNHQPSSGGSDQEDAKDVMIRGPRQIKSRNRAITKEDFEWLAYQAAGEIAKARCLPTTRVVAGNLRDESPGWVTVIIVPGGEMTEPLPNEGLIRNVKAYLARYASSTIVDQIDVIGPTYVRIGIEAAVIPRNIEQAKAVEKRVSENIAAFLHPVKGGPERRGWEFGKDVYFSEVAALIQGTEGVDRVREVVLRTPQGETTDHVSIPENGLPSSGEHLIKSIGA
jgi:predicted phage baseplate assembly protein